MAISDHTIVKTLYDRLWSVTPDNKVVLFFDDYKTAMIRGRVMQTMSTIKIKWEILSTVNGFKEAPTSDRYIVDLNVIRAMLGEERENTEKERQRENFEVGA